MRPTLYAIPTPAPGALSIMPCPRGGSQLDDDLAGLRRAGVDVLVCLQTEAECEQLGLSDEPGAATRAGLRFLSYPIQDFGVPGADVEPLLDALAACLAAGEHVVVHCRGGIGRSSVVAAALLVRLGTPAAQTWQVIASSRGCAVPETEEQRRWLAGRGVRGTQKAHGGNSLGSQLSGKTD